MTDNCKISRSTLRVSALIANTNRNTEEPFLSLKNIIKPRNGGVLLFESRLSFFQAYFPIHEEE